MAVLITEVIPQQGFEIVLNRLGAILFDEIANQVEMQSLTDEVEVYIERMQPFDKSEDVFVNVSMSSDGFQGQTQIGSQGECVYFVDVYARGEWSDSRTGNDDVRLKLHRYLGMCRYILNSTKYKTLAFSPPLVTGVLITSIQFDDNYGRQDGAFIRFARLSVTVKVNENQVMWDSRILAENDTTIKHDLTEKGFKLIFNNI